MYFFVCEVCTKATEDVLVDSTSATTVKHDHGEQTISDQASTTTDAPLPAMTVTAASNIALTAGLIAGVVPIASIVFTVGILGLWFRYCGRNACRAMCTCRCSSCLQCREWTPVTERRRRAYRGTL